MAAHADADDADLGDLAVSDDAVEADRLLGVVAIVVIGGLAALVGPVLGALWVVGVPAIWPNEPIVPFLVSDFLRITLLLFFPIISLYLVHTFRQ